ncbi:MAG: hypothetical protein WC178_01040 [Candidatus Paceibacterota bacterium]
MQLISDKTLQEIERALGLDFLDKEKRASTMTEIVALISNRAGLRIIKEFSEEEAEKFNQIPENNLEEMENYILAKNPNAKNIFEEEAQKTKEDLLKMKP